MILHTLLQVGQMKKIILSNFFLLLLTVNVHAKSSVFLDYLPLYDKTKYDANFSNFSYVDPNAKKGGSIVLPEYGTFDSFNPFIFKVIIDMYDPITIFLSVLGLFSVGELP